MAAGGDFGAAISPQLLGIVVDKVSASKLALDLGVKFNLTAEQIGLKAGMLASSIFPIVGIAVVLVIMRYFKRNKTDKQNLPLEK